MFEQIIMMLIYICLFVAVAYVVLWVLGQIGVSLPPMVVRIFWIIIGLIVLLMFVRLVMPGLSSGKLMTIGLPLLM